MFLLVRRIWPTGSCLLICSLINFNRMFNVSFCSCTTPVIVCSGKHTWRLLSPVHWRRLARGRCRGRGEGRRAGGQRCSHPQPTWNQSCDLGPHPWLSGWSSSAIMIIVMVMIMITCTSQEWSGFWLCFFSKAGKRKMNKTGFTESESGDGKDNGSR